MNTQPSRAFTKLEIMLFIVGAVMLVMLVGCEPTPEKYHVQDMRMASDNYTVWELVK
jgi:hypothetical protein